MKLRFLLLLVAAAAGLSQNESDPYFALSSARTFGPADKPVVSLSAWNVDSLEFRVYRVNDPVQFFQQLEDPHVFGGHVPRPPQRRTLLERVHRWKRTLRADIRRNLRAQFTESPSAHLAPKEEPKAPAKPVERGTKYSDIPVLNSEQMVLNFMQPVRSKNRWEQHTVDIAVHDKGVYLVEAVRGDLRAYTILMVSDAVLITKTARGRIVNMLVERQSGQPIAGAQIAMLARDRRLGEATTNADGVAEMPPASDRADDLRMVARRGPDVAVNAVGGWAFGAEGEEWMGYIYTDRPVYRPGHTVHFKGILRIPGGQGYRVPSGESVAVTINTPDQKPVYQKTLTANANGTIRDEFTLPADTALGHYFMEVKAGERNMSGDFEVEEYKKPEYEVRVTPSTLRVLQGQSAQATIEARYYFGEPVAGAKVKYAVYRDRYWFPMWYDPDDQISDGPPPEDDDGGDQVAETDATLNADGKLTVAVPTAPSDHKFDYRYRVDARVTDAAGREIVGKGGFIAIYGSFAVNVEPQRYFYEPGAKATLNVDARTYDNQPVRTRVKLELLKWDYRKPDARDVRGTAEADSGGAATIDIPREGGSYRVRATARTPEGREVEDYAYLWVAGGGAIYDFDSGRGVQIIPDKKSYRAGETVKVLIVTGQPNTPVYMSVEGRELRSYKLLRSPESTVSFDVPTTANDEPGVTVNATFVRNGNLFNGTKYVKIPPVGHQLNLAITTDKPQYQPGQPATYNVVATTSDGKPVPRAEVSLGIVDEAIYAIKRDSTPDILQFFFNREWNRVMTESSLQYFFSGEAGKRRMRLAGLQQPQRLAQLKPERLVEPKVRKVFPDTAYWAADLVTDNAGRAQAKLEFPDSLTTWRATARGVTADTKVGSAIQKTIVRKNLILRLAVPRFFVQGDEVVISALVHNYLAEAKTARVSLDFEGLDVLDGATRDVQIASRGDARLDWRVRAKQVSTAKVRGKALTNEESDALELDLPVNVPGVKMSDARGGSVSAGASAAFDLAFPQSVTPGSRTLSIRVSPSVVGGLFGALEYLTSFPYGCVEQTMSSFLPNITVQQAARDLKLKTDLDERALREKVRAGLERLYNYQHEDGGWGWWQTDESHPFMTAYVVAGLAQAKSVGTEINDDAVRRGADWLVKAVADRKLAGDLRAYMAYALVVSGRAADAPLGRLYDLRSEFSPYGLAILGLALEQTKDGRAADVAAALERAVQQDNEQAWWPATRDQMLDFSDDATPEATAYALKFLSHQRAGSPLLPKAALWLMNHRNEGFWWSSTKQTAMVIYGLIDYLKATGELNSNITATVFVNDKPVLTRKLDGADPALTLDESKLNAAGNSIRVTATGTGRVYYSARAEYHSNADRVQKVGSGALNVTREYLRLVPTQSGDKIVYDTTALTGPAAPGDVIAVRLTVAGSEWKYLMIEDPIPAGTEFIAGDNAYPLRNRPPWWQYLFSRREFHDDRMALFQTWFPKGQHEYFYLLKVVNAGVFQVSPAKVAPMYQTGVMATSDAHRLEVK